MLQNSTIYWMILATDVSSLFLMDSKSLIWKINSHRIKFWLLLLLLLYHYGTECIVMLLVNLILSISYLQHSGSGSWSTDFLACSSHISRRNEHRKTHQQERNEENGKPWEGESFECLKWYIITGSWHKGCLSWWGCSVALPGFQKPLPLRQAE